MKFVIEQQIYRGQAYPMYDLTAERTGFLLESQGNCGLSGRQVIRAIKRIFKNEKKFNQA